jgi:hypothetical protein
MITAFQNNAYQNNAFQIDAGTSGAYLLGTYVDKYGMEFCIAMIAVLTSFVI